MACKRQVTEINSETNSEGKGDASEVEEVSIVSIRDGVGGSSDAEMVGCVESPGGNASESQVATSDMRRVGLDTCRSELIYLLKLRKLS